MHWVVFSHCVSVTSMCTAMCTELCFGGAAGKQIHLRGNEGWKQGPRPHCLTARRNFSRQHFDENTCQSSGNWLDRMFGDEGKSHLGITKSKTTPVHYWCELIFIESFVAIVKVPFWLGHLLSWEHSDICWTSDGLWVHLLFMCTVFWTPIDFVS